MRDPAGDGWLMFFTARARHRRAQCRRRHRARALGRPLSLGAAPPVFAGGFGQLEVPQVCASGDKWVCLFCTAGRHWSAAYRAARIPATP